MSIPDQIQKLREEARDYKRKALTTPEEWWKTHWMKLAQLKEESADSLEAGQHEIKYDAS